MPVRPIRETIPLDEARQILFESARPIDRTERISIRDAHGRVIAQPAVSKVDVPPFDRAAMDGYAVIAEDTFGASGAEPRVLRCIESIFTGQVASERVVRGTCIAVATGAPLPDGADAVVMIEETETERVGDSDVRVMTPVYPKQHVGRRAADIAIGQTLLAAGDVLTPSRIGALAAIGASEIDVYVRPRVAILSTGNEIVEPGQPLAPGQIYDINQFTLSSIIGAHGGIALVYPTAADSVDALMDAIAATKEDDVLVFSGGSSVGEKDLILDAIGRAGDILFHGIAVKPGKPTAFGTIGRRAVFGMPGYPTSCLSNAYMLLVPMLRRIARLPAHHPLVVRLPLARRVVSTTGRHQFYTVRVVDGAAVPAFKASGDITSMSLADGYIEIPAQTDIVEAGELVDVKLF
jgi:molybdenum cofactor synthesis domain-containing protein